MNPLPFVNWNVLLGKRLAINDRESQRLARAHQKLDEVPISRENGSSCSASGQKLRHTNNQLCHIAGRPSTRTAASIRWFAQRAAGTRTGRSPGPRKASSYSGLCRPDRPCTAGGSGLLLNFSVNRCGAASQTCVMPSTLSALALLQRRTQPGG